MKSIKQIISFRTFSRVIKIILILLALFLFLALIIPLLFQKNLANYLEAKMNKTLKGHHVTITSAHFQILGPSLTLNDLIIKRDEFPDPAIAHIKKIRGSIDWRALLSLKLVADILIENPKMHINLLQVQQEKKRETKVTDESWQKSLKAIYFLDINSFRVKDGDIIYIDTPKEEPLHVEHLNITANDIDKEGTPEKKYPSQFQVDGVIFNKGNATIYGDADFLKEPYAGMITRFKLTDIPLDRFKSILKRRNIEISGNQGSLSAHGEVQYDPKIKSVHIENLTIKDINLDYIYSPGSQGSKIAKKEQKEITKAAKKAVEKPEAISIKLDHLKMINSEFGYSDKSRTPGYRVFISHFDLDAKNLSNKASEGISNFNLNGLFMGSGKTFAKGLFRPRKAGSDFDLKMEIKQAKLVSLNEVLKAYQKVDVSKGLFSLYIDLKLKDQQISGYIRPFFENVDVYDPEKDANKNLFKQLYEMLIGTVAELLENRYEAVATTVEIEGLVDNPQTSTLQIILGLLKNAFIKSLLPGPDKPKS
ncbi:MAG: DUF748 domain-containing protein [Oligoflexia bacterium]|nr:DUF748 domain-containing protein [Oligoflexia bacterium]